jgi:hypothetical protein
MTEAEEKVKQIQANILAAQSAIRAVLTEDAVPWNSMWVITYTFEFPQ